MAKDKKSFLLYCDLLATVDELTDDEAGKLFKHVLRYVNDLNPEPPDKITKIAFEPIKQSLKRDLVKYESIKQKRSIAGQASAEAKKAVKEQQISTNLTSVESEQQNATQSTVSDNVTVSVSVSDNVKVNNIEERKLKFASTLTPFIPTYGINLINDFYRYWTEPNRSETKLRCELEKTWSLERRLETWAKRDNSFLNKNKLSNQKDIKHGISQSNFGANGPGPTPGNLHSGRKDFNT